MDTVKTIYNDTRTKRTHILYDSDPESPRDWENLATIVSWHSRYSLGDGKDNNRSGSIGEWLEEMICELGLEYDNYDLPLRRLTTEADAANKEYRMGTHWTYNKAERAGKWEHIENANPALTFHDFMDALNNGEDWAIAEAWARIERTETVIVPLYCYEHGGITISTGRFSCPWDSGQFGFAYVTEEKIKELNSGSAGKWIGKNRAERAAKVREIINGEIETYDQYLRGNVYGIVVETFTPTEIDPDGEGWENDADQTDNDENWNESDSCWGFYGLDYAIESAKEMMED